MKIGMVSDSPGHSSFEQMLDAAARLGIGGVEMPKNAAPSEPNDFKPQDF